MASTPLNFTSASSTAIDLSRLPPPDVVEALDFEGIFNRLRADFLTRYPEFTAFVESDPAIKLLEVVAYSELVLRQRINDAARSVLIAYALGGDLDNLPGNIFGLLVVLTCVPLFAAILRIPFSIIAPLILVLCAIGAYTVHNSTFDVVMMLVFGVVGYVMKKCNYPLAPMVLAIVLGDKAEESFRQSLLASQGSLGIFFSNGLVSSIMALGLIALFWPMLSNVLTRLRPRPAL